MRNRKFLIEQVENLLFYLMPTRRRKLLRGIDSIQCLKVVLTNQMRNRRKSRKMSKKKRKTIILYKNMSYIFALFLEIFKIFFQPYSQVSGHVADLSSVSFLSWPGQLKYHQFSSVRSAPSSPLYLPFCSTAELGQICFREMIENSRTGIFRVTFFFCFKTGPSAQPFIWKWVRLAGRKINMQEKHCLQPDYTYS